MAKGKPQEHRHPLTLAQNRVEEARLYAQGVPQAVIAARLGISQQLVSADLKAIQKEWMANAEVEWMAGRARELAKIDAVELEYWEQYQRSKEPRKRILQMQRENSATGSVSLQVGEETEERPGNPVYLAGVLSCIDRRIKLMGYDAVDKATVDLADAIKTYAGFDPNTV